MIRQKPSAAMQKTYDDCYLVCSTAVYFESQGNEAEALRSWRNALDQIYYFNAYRRPANWAPKTETEKALQASLRELELQCKERVDLFEALKESRKDAKKEKDPAFTGDVQASGAPDGGAWLGQGTVPPVNYPDLTRPPPLPKRPSFPKSRSSDGGRAQSLPAQPFPIPSFKKTTRNMSPEKKGGMLKTLRPTPKDGRKASSSSRPSASKGKPPAAAKAATQAWGSISGPSKGPALTAENSSKEALSMSKEASARPSFDGAQHPNGSGAERSASPFYFKYPAMDDDQGDRRAFHFSVPESDSSAAAAKVLSQAAESQEKKKPPTPPPHKHLHRPLPARQRTSEPRAKATPGFPSYRSEYPSAPVNSKKLVSVPKIHEPISARGGKLPTKSKPSSCAGPPSAVHRKALTSDASQESAGHTASPTSGDDSMSSELERETRPRRRQVKGKARFASGNSRPTPTSDSSSEDLDDTASETSPEDKVWKERMERCLKRLPKGVDEAAAKQIFNEIVIHGDEVHWDDVAGLEVAKSALKETVVYPFLRPDLFMGLREPARGMLLFGPPGTGKTMLARAVATESKSTFFAISASSLTSKYLGESEKLVRALFQLAKALAPSIIFVDEIDSLLSSRSGSSEHEATRRIKTEFLIQWSDLAKAAAGREQNEKEKEKGDASRVLVLAATNLPWTIDEAARRRFVRRQYIPLPEDRVRKLQLQTLLSHQKHNITDEDLDRLVEWTEGFSGSDITALAKDAAMGPLRSLGEKLLHMTMDEIRPMQVVDFQASLANIRPSVSRQGLKEYEDWAKEFGERGG
ncbi:aaa family atpase [Diplodia corticola]|uniref:Aaa family atpase n=1 Tax=Diplodia corticola TaxID=236234 RepID=A0A1J9R948_9PEZI|nr:aaa family atpase [Diplodia corticola]OJD38062.1 aaa family atpase [Diplodia corticola]